MQYVKLEDEIDEIQEISDIRDHLQNFLCKGLVELSNSFDNPSNEWREIGDEPNDLIYPSLLRILATRRFNWYQSRTIERLGTSVSPTTSDVPREKLLLRSNRLFETFNRMLPQERAECLLKPDDAVGTPCKSRASIFQCARVLQATVAGEKNAPNPGFLIAYYEIVRELYDVSPPFYSMGAARSRPGAPQTAFMTGECAKALNSVARAIDSTSQQIRLFRDFVSTIFRLINNEHLPKEWAAGKIKSIVLDLRVSNFYEKQRAICNLLNTETEAAAEKIASFVTNATTHRDATVYNAIIELFRTFAHQLSAVIDQFNNRFSIEIGAIANFIKLSRENFRQKEREALRIYGTTKNFKDFENYTNAQDRRKSFELTSKSGYKAAQRAVSVIEKLKLLHAQAFAFSEIIATLDARTFPQRFPGDFVVACDEGIEECEILANSVRNFLPPSKTFLEAVLDRELASEKGDRINPTELVFAAASLLELNPDHLDERYERTVEIAMTWITGDGLLDSYSYLDTDNSGYSLVLLGSEVLKSLAQILERVHTPLSAQLCRRIANYYQRHGVFERSQPNSLVGWMHDFPRIASKAQRWTSALALMSLEFVTRAMSAQLNRRIAKHFMTKNPSPSEKTLESLIYPDFGLITADGKLFLGNPECANESTAFFAQRMRAHVQGIDPKSIGFRYDAPCFSLVLFGPPGTGKTNLVHTIANTANTLVIEVTPSDILVEGEAFAEKQAKLVFRALSMLTNVVILFDEFDSLLRRRDPNDKPNVYSFITPGLLPKLADLYKKARDRRCAYALATNRVATLDEAAIRKERFDFKVGVYPPDEISRKGQIFSLLFDERIEQFHGDIVKTNDNLAPYIPKIEKIAEEIAGLSIVGLVGKGNFGAWTSHSTSPKPNTIQAELRKSASKNIQLDLGKPDYQVDAIYHADLSNNIYLSEIYQWCYSIDEDEKKVIEKLEARDKTASS
jgi:hypothetical protein